MCDVKLAHATALGDHLGFGAGKAGSLVHWLIGRGLGT